MNKWVAALLIFIIGIASGIAGFFVSYKWSSELQDIMFAIRSQHEAKIYVNVLNKIEKGDYDEAKKILEKRVYAYILTSEQIYEERKCRATKPNEEFKEVAEYLKEHPSINRGNDKTKKYIDDFIARNIAIKE